MKLITVALSLALVGCAHTQPPGVNIPIPVPCKVEEPKQPDYRYAPPYENIFDAVRDLLGDRELSKSYENELRIALKSCK